MLDDLLLVKKIKEGDIKTFEYLFRKYYSSLIFYSTGITGRADVAEEIIQDLFFVLWKDHENLNIFRSLKAYLYGAVRNRSLGYCERRKLDDKYRGTIDTTSFETTTADAQDDIEYKELVDVVERAMEKMPARRRKIFNMHRFENLKYIEIAQALSLSVKTIEAEMGKALKALRKEIDYHTNI